MRNRNLYQVNVLLILTGRRRVTIPVRGKIRSQSRISSSVLNILIDDYLTRRRSGENPGEPGRFQLFSCTNLERARPARHPERR